MSLAGQYSFMKKKSVGMSITATLLLTVMFGMAMVQVSPTAHAATAMSYSFNLVGPNASVAGATIPGTPIVAGDIIRFTGSGAFDPSTNTASGGGSFTHARPDGTIVAQGTWEVTAYQSFASYGGPNSGHQGGLLLVTVTLFGPEATFAGLTLQVSATINAPDGAPNGGTTLPGLFSEPTGGQAAFHAGQ